MKISFYRTVKKLREHDFSKHLEPSVSDWEQVFAKTVFPGFFGLDYYELLILLQSCKKLILSIFQQNNHIIDFFSVFFEKLIFFSKKKIFSLKTLMR